MSQSLLTAEKLLEHWQGHRRLTLRTLEIFPEDELFNHQVENMRSFAELMMELLDVETSVFDGLTTGEWAWRPAHQNLASKQALQAAFEKMHGQTQDRYAQLTPEKLQTVETDAWGMTSSNLERLLYVVDNEIHHRAQGFVYLRLLGLEPPKFYER